MAFCHAIQTGNVVPTFQNFYGLMRMDVSSILFRSTHGRIERDFRRSRGKQFYAEHRVHHGR